jgi:hypothetical protein
MSVARSDERRAALLLAAALAVGACGCGTTQEQNARLKLRADRVLASQRSMLVRRVDPSVTVERIAQLHSSAGTAIAVTLHNGSARPVSDLPITVGSGHDYLNRAAGTDYFQTHIGAIAAGSTTTWVFTTTSPSSGRPFALVGMPALTSDVPTVSTGWRPGVSTTAAGASGGMLEARVTNTSGYPQYDLTVYGHAVDRGQLVAAGQASVAELDPGSTTTVPIPLIGNPGKAAVELSAPPTIIN